MEAIGWVAKGQERWFGGERQSVGSNELGSVKSAERPMANTALERISERFRC